MYVNNDFREVKELTRTRKPRIDEFNLTEINIETTSDKDLFKVYLGKTHIGSIRKEPSGWLPIGAFVFMYDRDSSSGMINDLFETKEEAVKALVAAWGYQLGRLIAHRNSNNNGNNVNVNGNKYQNHNYD